MSSRRIIPALAMLIGAASSLEIAGSTGERRDSVVVLHGLARTGVSMNRQAGELRKAGYEVINFSYPSTRQSVSEAARLLHQELQKQCASHTGQIHFVTHSLGGIVVRAYLKQHRPANLGHVVMLCPPNQGSEVADRFRRNFIYRLTAGPAGQELGTEPTSTPNMLGAVDYSVGVITGDRSLNPLFSAWLPGKDDGRVTVQRARLEGMADFLVVPHSHTFIKRSSKVTRQIIHFLEQGKFDPIVL